MTNETTKKEDKQRGANSLLGVGDVECDKCGKMIRHLERYCYDTLECPVCKARFESISERDSHFSQEHPHEASRGTRYCQECCKKAGYLEK